MIIRPADRSRLLGPLLIALRLAAPYWAVLVGCGTGREDATGDPNSSPSAPATGSAADASPGWPDRTEFEIAQGTPFTLGGKEQTRATLLLFYRHDCPISNAYVPEIKRLGNQYAREFVIPCPVHIDAESILATRRW